MAANINLNSETPLAPGGKQNLTWQYDTSGNISAIDPVMIGDSGSGGKAGNVPAPGAGDAAANKFLRADGTWAVGASGSAGPQGPAGPIGATGAPGPQGVQGPQGSTGATGVQGPAAPTTWTGSYNAAGNNLTGLTSTTLLNSSHATWDEFKFTTGSNGSQQTDWLGFYYNTRSTAGGADNWVLAAYLGITNFWVFISAVQFLGSVTFSASATFNAPVTCAKGLNTGVRSVTTATDTATINDHTLILSGVTTETLPAAPGAGQEIYLVNTGASACTIAGNGKNIWSAGATVASLSLAAGATAILQYDAASATSVWRQIK